MSRAVIMKAPGFFAGDWLLVTGKPTAPLPDDVADRLIMRGRADEVEDVEAAKAIESGSPRRSKKRNRGADVVTGAPAADLPDIAVDPDPA